MRRAGGACGVASAWGQLHGAAHRDQLQPAVCHARLEPYADLRVDAHFVAGGVFVKQSPRFARVPATIAKDFTIDGLKPKVLKAQTGKGSGTIDRAWEQITKVS